MNIPTINFKFNESSHLLAYTQRTFADRAKLLALVLITFVTLMLAACSSGDGSGDTVRYIVTASAGDNGSISPVSTNVVEGNTTTFNVSADAGYLIDAVSASGCDGTLSASTYTTEPIFADCAITASFTRALPPVAALYPINGANWNDWVTGDAANATDTPCVAANQVACTHGGERKVVAVVSKSDCTGLSASDSEGAFDWQCEIGTGGSVRFVSTGFATGSHLSDLLDTSDIHPVFRNMSVRVLEGATTYAATPTTTWWNNTLVNTILGAGPTLSSPGAIFVVNHNSVGHYIIDADRTGLVIMPGMTLNGPDGGTSSYIIEATDTDFLWLEGRINAEGDDTGIRLDDVNYSVIRNLIANSTNNGDSIGVYLQSSSYNRIEDAIANNNSGTGIYLDTASLHNTLSRVTTNFNGNGLVIDHGSNGLTLSNLTANGNTEIGMWLDNATDGAVISNVLANDNAGPGLLLSNGAANNQVTNVTTSRNSIGLSLVVALNNTFTDIAASNNAQHGVSLVGASSNTFSEITAQNNGITDSGTTGAGLSLEVNVDPVGIDDYPDFNTFTTVTSTGNEIGIQLLDAADNTFSDLTVSANTIVDCHIDPITPTVREDGRIPGSTGLDSNCNPIP